MKKEPIAILLGYFANQLELVDGIMKEISAMKPAKREETTHLAYLLHNLYCSVEDIFQETAKSFENTLEDPAAYHRELLKRMRMDIPGIRPKLLGAESYHFLDELRGFRHVFRHAYDYELDQERVRGLQQRVLANWEHVDKDLRDFISFLRDALARG